MASHFSRQGERWTSAMGWGGLLAGAGVVAVMGSALIVGGVIWSSR